MKWDKGLTCRQKSKSYTKNGNNECNIKEYLLKELVVPLYVQFTTPAVAI